MNGLRDILKNGGLPRTQAYIDEVGLAAQRVWSERLAGFSPGWWGRMALSTGPGGGGGILIRRTPGGIRVYYANRGAYDYMNVIERGRGRYSIKNALLASPRARVSRKGERYIVVPMQRNRNGSEVNDRNNKVNSVLRLAGNYDDNGVTRKRYRTMAKVSGTGNVHAVQQGPVKGGGMQYSFVKFVVCMESSRGWMAKAFRGDPIQRDLRKMVKNAMQSNNLKRMIEKDVSDFLKK